MSDLIARLRERHQPHGYNPDYCHVCVGRWPCDVTLLLDVCAAARRRRDARDLQQAIYQEVRLQDVPSARLDVATLDYLSAERALDAALARLEATDARE